MTLRNIFENYLGSIVRKELSNKIFPNSPWTKIRIYQFVLLLLIEFRKRKLSNSFGNLFTYPSKLSSMVWKNLIQYSPNNSGNWTAADGTPGIQEDVEQNLINRMTNLYKTRNYGIEGYVTTGATEGNIYSLWIGKKYLMKRLGAKPKIILLKTSLTHYSVDKAADLIGVQTRNIKLDNKNWGMSPSDFKKAIEIGYKKGITGYVVCITLGYTSTGTLDPYKEIAVEINRLKNTYRDLQFYVWIDAALLGLILPFQDNKFKPFDIKIVQAFVTDFHKFGFVPIPSGVVLYRKELRKLIEKPINYLSYKDSTLLGSRNAISPIASWVEVNSLAKKGFKRVIKRNLQDKKDFMKRCVDAFGKKVSFVTNSNIPVLGIIINRSLSEQVVVDFEKKYDIKFYKTDLLTENGKLRVNLAKAFFLKRFD